MNEQQSFMVGIGTIVIYKNLTTWITYIKRHRTKGTVYHLEGISEIVGYKDVDLPNGTVKNIYGDA